VNPLLEAEGHRVVAPDLPGHGKDRTPLEEVSLQAYADRVCALLATESEPVILLGHSMGGIVITQVAEQCPERIRTLVYLCAFLPSNGESLGFWAEQMTESLVAPNMVIAEDQRSATVRDDLVIDAFYGDCQPDVAAWAKSRLQPQAMAPIVAPVNTSEQRFGRVERQYIECLQDRAIPIAMQRSMQKAQPCRSVRCLNSGHSPFFAVPEALVSELLSLEADIGERHD
jgi:pimeloyl-ACP methyl ester carboxylesterase